jgi:hypothetical protein
VNRRLSLIRLGDDVNDESVKRIILYGLRSEG